MNVSFFKRDNCRFCASNNLVEVLPLAPSALCDAYVPAERLQEKQDVYPVGLFMCRECGYVYLPYVIDPEVIYREYLYVSTSSLGFVNHFKEYAEDVLQRTNLNKGSFVIDIGSNDGTLLRFFKDSGMRVLGIEPAKKIAQDTAKAGVDTICDFFSFKSSDRIKKDYGQPVIITINNLLANIDDLEDFIKGVSRLLAPGGFFIIESSYLGDVMQNLLFDTIYHEHLSYFSIKPLMNFLSRFGMELVDLQHNQSKGGSLRYYFQSGGDKRKASSAVKEMLAHEEKLGLDKIATYTAYAEKIDSLKDTLNGQLKGLKAKGKTVAGYGASSSCTAFIYNFNLARELDYIIDDNPIKQNKFSPGYHIPVLPTQALYERKPDYVLVLAWRYAEPIIKKHDAFLKGGGHFIVPLPQVKIL